MKNLITGSTRFIGSYIVGIFPDQAGVEVLDNLGFNFRYNLNGLRCEFIQACKLDRDHFQAVIRRVDFFILNHGFPAHEFK